MVECGHVPYYHLTPMQPKVAILEYYLPRWMKVAIPSFASHSPQRPCWVKVAILSLLAILKFASQSAD